MVKRQRTEQPGNDASWFLDLVGAPSTAERRPETFADLPITAAAPPKPAAAAVAKLDGPPPPPPSAAPATTAPPSEQTTELVGKLWEATGTQDPLDGWAPEELAATLRSRRNFRWTVVVLLVTLGSLVWVAAAWLPSVPERRADARAMEYDQVLGQLRAVLPAAQDALAAVTDVDGFSDQIALIVSALTDLDTAAERTRTLAAAPLPAGIPLISDEPISDLEPSRDRLGIIGDEADALALRIGAALSYRTSLPSILALPPLPVEAGTADINQLSVELAAALADAAEARADLPAGDPAFADHLAAIDALIARFSDWQVEYLDALRRGDRSAAIELVDEIIAARRQLDEQIVDALVTLRTEADGALLDLAGEIDRARAALPL